MTKKRTKRPEKKRNKGERNLPLVQWLLILLVVVLGLCLARDVLLFKDHSTTTKKEAKRLMALLARQKGWTLLSYTWVKQREGRHKWVMGVSTWRVEGSINKTIHAPIKPLPQVRLKHAGGKWSYYMGSREILRLLIIQAHREVKEEVAPKGHEHQVAIVIDDMGYRMDLAKAFLALPWPITISILPFTPKEKQIARMAYEGGKEVMLHIPMAANGGGEAIEKLESRTPGMLQTTMSDEEIRRLTQLEIQEVPYAKGANNHMGSLFTRDPKKIRIVLQELQAKGYYFLDSLTDSRSVAYKVALSMGMRCFKRDVFLDNSKDVPYILHQLHALACLAKKRGYAIAIGHPSRATLLALQQGIPRLEKEGVRVVPLSKLAIPTDGGKK